MVGAPGTPIGAAGVTLLEAVEAADDPIALIAFTEHVTAVPLVSGETIIGDAVPLEVTLPQVAL